VELRLGERDDERRKRGEKVSEGESMKVRMETSLRRSFFL